MISFESKFDYQLGEVDYRIAIYQAAVTKVIAVEARDADSVEAQRQLLEELGALMVDLEDLQHRLAGSL
ncbi:MAG TPA: hypothetical protein VNN23_08130 [Ornithinibacter sp.]|nr:hypothetical protein [Ornithinibacter sp.]